MLRITSYNVCYTKLLRGYNAMSDLTHHVENIFDLIRNGSLKVNQDILDTTLIVVDHLFALLKDEDNEILKHKQEELISWCNRYQNSKGTTSSYSYNFV